MADKLDDLSPAGKWPGSWLDVIKFFSDRALRGRVWKTIRSVTLEPQPPLLFYLCFSILMQSEIMHFQNRFNGLGSLTWCPLVRECTNHWLYIKHNELDILVQFWSTKSYPGYWSAPSRDLDSAFPWLCDSNPIVFPNYWIVSIGKCSGMLDYISFTQPTFGGQDCDLYGYETLRHTWLESVTHEIDRYEVKDEVTARENENGRFSAGQKDSSHPV